MIGFLLNKKHFSSNNIKSICGEIQWSEISVEREDCYQCERILLNPCSHNDYYCISCMNTEFTAKGENYGTYRKCFAHVSLIEINKYFEVYKACLKCYRKLVDDWTSRDMLPPADFSKFLPLVREDELKRSENEKEANKLRREIINDKIKAEKQWKEQRKRLKY